MLSSSLIGILAQRLLRKVCSGCRMPYTPSEERLHAFGLLTSRVSSITFYRAQSLSNQEIDECKRTGQSVCSTCNGAGYKGRIGVYELLRLSDKLRDLINREAPTDMLREVAIEEGMKTLLTYSLQLVIEGRTTLEEVERVTLSDSGLEAAQKGNTTLVCRTCFASLHPEWLDCPYCTTPRIAT
jgi:type IV pilus assembly protein PilB